MAVKENRNKKILGYLLILLGILIPLYGFTGLSKNIVGDEDGYKKFLNDSANSTAMAEERKRAEHYNEHLDKRVTIVDPFSTDDFKTDYKISKDPHAIFAYLRIPAIDVLQPIRLDASSNHLAKGVAHVDGTSLPIGGKGKRSVIAGHRGYYQSIMFLNLDELKAGDDVFVERKESSLRYKVVDKEVINPSDWEKLNPVETKDMLTLLTCTPLLPPRPHRLLVNCERVVKEKNEPAFAEKTPVHPSNKMVRTVTVTIVMITAIGWIAVLIVAIKFIAFLRKEFLLVGKSADNEKNRNI